MNKKTIFLFYALFVVPVQLYAKTKWRKKKSRTPKKIHSVNPQKNTLEKTKKVLSQPKHIETKPLNPKKHTTKNLIEPKPKTDYSKKITSKTKPKAKQEKKIKTITFSNTIEKKHLDQKKGFFPVPIINFSLSVNNAEVMQIKNKKVIKNNIHELSLSDDTLTIVYEFDFGYGKRSQGKRQEIFELEKDTNQIDLGFSWKDTYHAKIAGATPVKKIEL